MTNGSSKLRKPESGSARSGMPNARAHAKTARASSTVEQVPSPANTSARAPASRSDTARATSLVIVTRTETTPEGTISKEGTDVSRETSATPMRAAAASSVASALAAASACTAASGRTAAPAQTAASARAATPAQTMRARPPSNSLVVERSGFNGSSNGKFRCTGPPAQHPAIRAVTPQPSAHTAAAAASPTPTSPPAAAHASRAACRANASDAASALGRGICRNARTWSPYAFSWSHVCGAPRPCRRGGRSPVSTISGTRDDSASSTAG